MDWFRLYSEIASDPKIRKFPLEIRWRFIEILCLASEQKPRGTLPDLWTIADFFRMKESKASKILDGFLEAGLIAKTDDGLGLTVSKWESRQYQSDTSTNRVRAYRDRLGASDPKHAGNVHETFHGRSCNVSVTPSDTDTETETEEERDKKKNLQKKKADPVPIPTDVKPPFTLPDWVPVEDWDAFMEVRKHKKAAQTDNAFRLLIRKLEALRSEGHPPSDVIQQSIRSSWTDVFPLRDGPKSAQPERPKYHVEPADSPLRKRTEAIWANVREIFRDQGATEEPGSRAGGPGELPLG